MSKRRTRKQKEKAKHQFTFPSSPGVSQARVKGQNNIGYEAKISQDEGSKSADLTAQAGSTPSAKRDIIKSLLLVSFILSLELVVYLAWNVKR